MATQSTTCYVVPETRELIEQLAAGLGLTLTPASVAALGYYRELLDTGTPDRPASGQIRSGTNRLTVADQDGIGAWLTERVEEWQTTRRQILATAFRYYAAAIKSGEIFRPAPKPKPEKPKTPKKTSPPQPARPIGTPPLNDRALCGVCHKQFRVDTKTSLLVPHIAPPSVRPKLNF